MKTNGLLTIPELCNKIRTATGATVQTPTVYQWIKKGLVRGRIKLKATYVGARPRVKWSDYLRFTKAVNRAKSSTSAA